MADVELVVMEIEKKIAVLEKTRPYRQSFKNKNCPQIFLHSIINKSNDDFYNWENDTINYESSDDNRQNKSFMRLLSNEISRQAQDQDPAPVESISNDSTTIPSSKRIRVKNQRYNEEEYLLKGPLKIVKKMDSENSNDSSSTDSSNKRSEFERHLPTHEDDRISCEIKVNSHADLENHMDKDHTQKTFQCDAEGCDIAFPTSQEMNMHFLNTHKSLDLVCHHCSNVFRSKIDISVHLRSYALGGMNYIPRNEDDKKLHEELLKIEKK